MDDRALVESLDKAVVECYSHNFPETARALMACRDYIIANRLDPSEQSAFKTMINDTVFRAEAERRSQSIWNKRGGKVLVIAAIVGGVIAVVEFMTAIVTRLGFSLNLH